MPHDHHEDPHPYQPDVEDSPYSRFMVMGEAVGELLIEKGVFTADQLMAMVDWMESRKPELGARLVAKAWSDPAFEARLMASVNEAAQEIGIDAGTIPIRAIANTDDVHNVIVCTLCSCYPRQLLGIPPDWYKSRAYRARTIKEPRVVLEEFGLSLPDKIEVRVHDSTADLRYMVVPQRPAGTEDLDEEALAALVTRNSLVGVGLPRAPGE